MANPSTKPLLPAGSAVHTVAVKVVIGSVRGNKQRAVRTELVAQEIASRLHQLRQDFGLASDELSWEFPFWARSLNG
jgi:hypothetical protein